MGGLIGARIVGEIINELTNAGLSEDAAMAIVIACLVAIAAACIGIALLFT